MRKLRQFLLQNRTKMNQIFIYFLFSHCNLRSFNFEFVERCKSLMLSRSLWWYTFFFLYFLKISFFFHIFNSFCKGIWMSRTYPAVTLAAIHRLFLVLVLINVHSNIFFLRELRHWKWCLISHLCMEQYRWLFNLFGSIDNLKRSDYDLLKHLPVRKTTVFVNNLGNKIVIKENIHKQ